MEEKLEQFIIEVLADPVRTKVLLELLEQEGYPQRTSEGATRNEQGRT